MSTTDQHWFHRRGELSRDGWESVVDDTLPGWQHTGIRVATLGAGDQLALSARPVERIFVPLSGSFEIDHDDHPGAGHTRLTGRASVFDGPTDILYLPSGASAVLRGAGRVAVAEAPCEDRREWRHLAAGEIAVELRGAGVSSREVHNLGTPGVLDAAKLIVCEVITPGGNWSSHPPHKHDEHRPGHETQLEEIYYFEAAPAREAATATADSAFGIFHTYPSAAGDIRIDAMVGTGDIALIPFGYHGPAVAPPGIDLYYLNVMAGPGEERAWQVSDDPAHAWVRDSWASQEIDARLLGRP